MNKLIESKVSLKEIYLKLFQRSMCRVGQMWEKEWCSVANEHLATKITESLVKITITKYLKKDSNGKLALITCIGKEHHELGARMVAGFFEAHGWDTLFLGSYNPLNELILLI